MTSTSFREATAQKKAQWVASWVEVTVFRTLYNLKSQIDSAGKKTGRSAPFTKEVDKKLPKGSDSVAHQPSLNLGRIKKFTVPLLSLGLKRSSSSLLFPTKTPSPS